MSLSVGMMRIFNGMSRNRFGFTKTQGFWRSCRVLNHSDPTCTERCIGHADKDASVFRLKVDLKNLLAKNSIVDTDDHAIGAVGFDLILRHGSPRKAR